MTFVNPIILISDSDLPRYGQTTEGAADSLPDPPFSLASPWAAKILAPPRHYSCANGHFRYPVQFCMEFSKRVFAEHPFKLDCKA